MTYRATRTCTEVAAAGPVEGVSGPLARYREVPAYVLLGDPGSGKTTELAQEVEAVGEGALLVSARDFLTFLPENRPEWRSRILFIDGLDEVRAGQSDARTPFDAIRGRLDALGGPPFRLSCRAADWLGAADRSKLGDVSPDGEVTVLNLDPLSESEIAGIVGSHPGIGDPEAFIMEARERGVGALLANPQNLELLVRLVGDGGGWPGGRRETFEGACSQMVAEHNVEHLSVHQPDTDQLLDAAGRLCLVHLVAGVPGYASRQQQPDEECIAPDRCDYEDTELLLHALSTKLFSMDDAGVARPVHRHLAEFVGARHLARLIEGGLPARRAIAPDDGRGRPRRHGAEGAVRVARRPLQARAADPDAPGRNRSGPVWRHSRLYGGGKTRPPGLRDGEGIQP